MDAADKRMLEREALRNMIQQWNANRLDLFELSEPNENLEFHGVMRFYFQDSGQKIATKCIRVASDATVSDVIETLIEKFRPDMRMLSLGSYSLWETHGPEDERRLEPHEKPLLVQLNWHADDREGRFLLKCTTGSEQTLSTVNEKGDQNFKRKLSKREKKELKKKEKLSRMKSDANNENRTAEKLYTEMPETSFTRSISNPEAVMRRRRQQKLERKLQQFRSKDGGPDTGGTLKIYGSSLCPDVPYKTLLLSIRDSAAAVVREMLDKYAMARHDPANYCIVQVDAADMSEYVLEDDECPLAVVMTHPHHSSIMFHVRRRPADTQPRRRKKKAGAGGHGARPGSEPALLEVAPDGSALENGRRVRVTDVVEVGSGNGMSLQLYGPSIQSPHCVVATAEGGNSYTVTPLHPDAQVFMNGQRVTHTQRLQHGCLLKFGRVSTFRFVDPAQETILSRNLAHSQHFGSGSIYERSPTSPARAMSPSSLASQQPDHLDNNANSTNDTDYQRTMSPVSHDAYYRDASDPASPYNNNNTLKLDNESLMLSQHLNDSKDDYIRDEHTGSVYNEQEQSAGTNRTAGSNYKDNYETTFDLEGNVETKSICSAKSGGSGHDNRMNSSVPAARPGQEAILPAVLEFPEAGQAQFLAAVVARLDPHAPAFKLAPVYTLYLCARYRASTHYRPELSPTERAHKLTAFLHHVATLIHATVQERCTDSAAQAFWMANASELLHFLKCDRHISSFSTQAQELLPTTVQNAFSNLVSCFQEELSPALITLNRAAVVDATEATAPTLQALAAAMVLLRRCRVNAALTIQLFSHLFHYVNAVCFNKLVTEPGMVEARWGAALAARLALLGAWAERQGLELAADCHLARSHQAARLIQGEYRSAEEVRAALAACFKLNSAQVRALLAPLVPADVLEAAAAHARALADELYRADGREITLEESEWLGVGLLIPGDGFSAEVVRGVPPGLAEFVAPLQRGGLCRLAHQPHAAGVWTVYMNGYGATNTRRAPEPRVHIIQLNKNSNGMGLSIVAAKGAGQSKLGIYIKSVVAGGAAAADGRLAAGDQLLSVDGHSLVGITQEKAAEHLVRTGPCVTLEVAKQGAVLHGLATLLHQPAYTQRPAEEVVYEHRLRRNSGTFTNAIPALLRPAPPRLELATAGKQTYQRHTHTPGYGRRSCDRHGTSPDESSESSSDDSEESDRRHRCHPHYHGSIPRLIITLDRENNQIQDEQSGPDTPGFTLELSTPQPPPRPIPVFTFTCEDFDEQHIAEEPCGMASPEEPPAVPEPPANYELSNESGEVICLPPEMRPIDTRFTLDLFNVRSRSRDSSLSRGRCTEEEECVSACECCRVPRPDGPSIPYIDEPDCEPLIFEGDTSHDVVTTPKTRRILPALSLDRPEENKPEMADAGCQTPCSPIDAKPKPIPPVPAVRKLDLRLNVGNNTKVIDNMHCRLKRQLFQASKSFSKSEETFSTSDSADDSINSRIYGSKSQTPLDTGAKKILDSVDRKSWKSPDEFRPSFGKVKALAKQFNAMNLRYSAKTYKRNCQSSPNLSVRDDKIIQIKENLQSSASLLDIQYESNKTDTGDTKGEKLSHEEVKSIIIQLEDWSKYGSRGSEDTLAQGNEFEVPNLPSEEHTENLPSNNGSLTFNEIVDKKPKRITLDNIQLKSNQSSVNSRSKESIAVTESLENSSIPRVVEMTPLKKTSAQFSLPKSTMSTSLDDGEAHTSCPDLNVRRASAGKLSNGHYPWHGSTGALRRASERDLPARLAAEPVKPSKSTPALHHVASPPPHAAPPAPPATANHSHGSAPAAAWAGKSRSSHNLSSATNDAFYQNLPHINDRWSSLRSSGSNRPQSVHYSAASPPEHAPESPLHHQQALQQNAMSVRAAKLAEMSEEVTRRQQHQQMMQQQQLQQQQLQQQQQQLQQQQQQQYPQKQSMLQHQHMMTPLHLANPHMQVQIPQQPAGQQMAAPMSPHHQLYHNHAPPQQRYDWHAPGPPSPQRSQPPVAPKPQGARRPDSEHEEQMMSPQQQTLLLQQQMMSPQQQQMISPQQQQMISPQQQQLLSPQQQQMLSPQQQQMLAQQQQQMMSPQQTMMSPQQQQMMSPQQQQMMASQQQQMISSQQQVNVQPEEDWYVASGMDPVYGERARAAPPHNPWQREEREREAEARRQAARARRDATITHLLSLGATRTARQNQQLRALQLEMDFERRATQADQEDSTEPTSPTSPAPRASPPPPPAAQPHTAQPHTAQPHTAQPHIAQAHTAHLHSAQPQPKSILKSRGDLNGYATDNGRSAAEEAAAALSVLQLAEAAPPPPPPERGSSFAVMAARAPPPVPANHVHTTPTSSQQRDKRVSFHERAAAAAPPAPAASPPPPAPPAASPPPLDQAPPQDPDRFIEEAESMLASPVSPATPAAAHTPGVIGAQEVYRDPRARRLAEKQALTSSAPIPEQLSFKEKMKMFALESGEAATPRDKVKISRAQRDIDAVH